jgi:hypothetical protein
MTCATTYCIGNTRKQDVFILTSMLLSNEKITFFVEQTMQEISTNR